jgi:aerobic-type carbon monoxide dehydrogenase small subunit (CoxS/CutS family)
MEGRFEVNGKPKTWTFDSRATLLHVLRENGHTEVKNGCSEGECGACLILLDGELVNACQVLAASATGRSILTVAGLGSIHAPNVIQTAFADAGAVQCGFCTPGMILAAHALLLENPAPDDEQIRSALDGNLCRCTGYVKIVEAVQLAAKRMGENG